MDIMLASHKNFLVLLLKHEVDFILIGGYAVIFYGYPRMTTDMDIWIRPDNSNRDKLIAALKEHGIRKEDLDTLSAYDFNKTQLFHTGEKPNRIDFLTKVAAVSFDEAAEQKVFFPLKDKQVPIIQYHHLILTKITSERLKDKADVEELQKINQYRNPPF